MEAGRWHGSCESAGMHPLPPSSSTPATLTGWLQAQARLRPAGLALRHKQAGLWQERRWWTLQQEVATLAAGLRARGFQPGHWLQVRCQPRPEALLLSLAALWLGGRVRLGHPGAAPLSRRTAASAEAHAHFVLLDSADDLAGLADLQAGLHWVGYVERRAAVTLPAGLQDRVQSSEELLLEGRAAGALDEPIQGEADDTAFLLQTEQGALSLSHRDLLEGGLALVDQEGLTHRDEAFAARAFATEAQLRYLLAPWLLTGLRLNFPERLATRDTDRREIGPTLVAGTCETYQRVARWVREALPPEGTWQRHLVERALAGRYGRLPRWVVGRRLRDVIGLTRTRAALLIGAPLPEDDARFFASLGVAVRVWPEGGTASPRPSREHDSAPPDERTVQFNLHPWGAV